MKQYTIDQLNDLLNRACEIITSLEGYANEHSHYPEHNRELQKSVDAFFNEIDYMNEDDEPTDVVQLERGDDVDWTMQTR